MCEAIAQGLPGISGCPQGLGPPGHVRDDLVSYLRAFAVREYGMPTLHGSPSPDEKQEAPSSETLATVSIRL
jgi:hypothetical protein